MTQKHLIFENEIFRMTGKEDKLDNPVWHSLSDIHKEYAIDYKTIKFYDPEYCPFGGSIDTENSPSGITEYSGIIGSFFVVGEKPLLDDSVIIKKNLICNQMILKREIEIDLTEQITPLESESQKNDLFDLVSLVQPGYFRKKTADLGRYFGIYKDSKLIAASGERMQMNEFTEISAIVTHPNHIRNGYAKQLIKHTSEQVFSENKIPYLHVLESNIGAVGLYEKLGFTTRRKISFWNLSIK